MVNVFKFFLVVMLFLSGVIRADYTFSPIEHVSVWDDDPAIRNDIATDSVGNSYIVWDDNGIVEGRTVVMYGVREKDIPGVNNKIIIDGDWGISGAVAPKIYIAPNGDKYIFYLKWVEGYTLRYEGQLNMRILPNGATSEADLSEIYEVPLNLVGTGFRMSCVFTDEGNPVISWDKDYYVDDMGLDKDYEARYSVFNGENWTEPKMATNGVDSSMDQELIKFNDQIYFIFFSPFEDDYALLSKTLNPNNVLDNQQVLISEDVLVTFGIYQDQEKIYIFGQTFDSQMLAYTIDQQDNCERIEGIEAELPADVWVDLKVNKTDGKFQVFYSGNAKYREIDENYQVSDIKVLSDIGCKIAFDDEGNVHMSKEINEEIGYQIAYWNGGANDITDNSVNTTELLGNYPNPFNPNTTIKFNLKECQNVKLTVYNVNGQLIQNLVNEQLNAGSHQINFDGSNLNSGVYYYSLQTNQQSYTKKMILIK